MRWYGAVRRFFDLRIIQISTEEAITDTIDDTERKMATVLLLKGNSNPSSPIEMSTSIGMIAGVVSSMVLLILPL